MKKIKYISIILQIIFISNQVCASHLYPEKTYQSQWCKKNKGEIEYILDDKTRVDCITNNYAIEFDFAKKWAEAVGQALYYGLKTQKQPAIVLIIENPQKEQKYINRLKYITENYDIKLWLTTPEELGLTTDCRNKKNTN